KSAIVLEAGRDIGDVEFRFDDRLAVVDRLELGPFRRVIANDLREAKEDTATRLCGDLAPRSALERAPSGQNGVVDIGGIPVRNARDDLLVRRVDDIDPAVGARVAERTVDVQTVFDHAVENGARRLAIPVFVSSCRERTMPVTTRLETDRLILRVPSLDDLDRWAELMANEQAARFIGGVMPKPVVWR